MRKFLFISIKPEFANKIMSKKKSIELRKNKPNADIGDFVLIYSTQPKKSVIGFAKIKRIAAIDNITIHFFFILLFV